MKLITFFLCSGLVGTTLLQDNGKTSEYVWDFRLQTPASPADPDPTSQADGQRLETLHRRIKDALSALESDDYRKFFNEYVDPTILVRQAAAANTTVEAVFKKGILGESENTKVMAADFKAALNRSSSSKPKWLLNGRAASFITDSRGRSAEFWIYIDGKWRLSFRA